jgi:hypothetical protein
MAVLTRLLVLFGNIIGRSAYFRVEAAKHYLNMFMVLVGDSSKGRKGTAYELVKSLFYEVDPVWSSDNQQGGLSSGEGLVWAVRDAIEKTEPVKEKGKVINHQKVVTDLGVEDKRLVAIEPEFAQVLKVASRAGNTLSTLIRQAWDSGNLRIMNKNAPVRATNAHISIIGHITRDELRRELSNVDAVNGYANRFLWVFGRRSKLLPEGGGFYAVDRTPLIERLRQAIDFAQTVTEMRRDEEAKELWREFYEAEAEGKPGLLGAITSRAEAQVVRLSCLYALLDCSDVVRRVHLEAAIVLWRYCEDSASFIFGKPSDDPLLAERILAMLREAPEGLTKTEIHERLGRNKKSAEIDRALATLVQEGKARFLVEPHDGPGRPAKRWYAVHESERG